LERTTKPEQRVTYTLAKSAGEYARLADPYDPAADLGQRARSYLHANCAQCHVEAGGGNSAINLHIPTLDGQMQLFHARPVHDTFEMPDPRLTAPGSTDRSILYQRLTRRGPGQMPPLATRVVDEQGAAMLREWITGLKAKAE